MTSQTSDGQERSPNLCKGWICYDVDRQPFHHIMPLITGLTSHDVG